MHRSQSKISPSAPVLDGTQAPTQENIIGRKGRFYIIVASLLGIFLGALDALIVSAAMPTIVADLGGLHLYSWVYSAYMLARAVSLPVFGKLGDLFKTRTLYLISTCVFILGSISAGLAHSMTQLIISRVFQGIGAGGNFAIGYVVLADISSPEKRGKTLSLASFIWGLASVLGPTMGGFIVTYFSWRWIFFINVPLGGISLLGIVLYLTELREKRKVVAIDYLGILTFSLTVLTLLTAFLLAGRSFDWRSPQIIGLLLITVASGLAFYHAEKHADDPLISLNFFRIRGFRAGNGAAFFSSFAIFSLFAFIPLYIQGALGKTPMQLGTVMLILSLGWSVGALVCGQTVHFLQKKPAAILGGVLLALSCGLTLTFSTATSLFVCSVVLGIAGVGMGFASIATLLVVQDSLESSNLGIATSSHQFARSLGGTVGVGISGSFLTNGLSETIKTLMNSGLTENLGSSFGSETTQSIENFFRPEIQALLSTELKNLLQESVSQGMLVVFGTIFAASLICFYCCAILPKAKAAKRYFK